ncbi:uncharacterized protein LOC123867977 [Maniola jurtina]|uniref:uncharacterized protein LOC123867976 n=1 Tax=Maniola jurtina TaxID=191418 RepID=UPI001E68F190|nr:uncharacterized protein LOC123867976 [Maniola jurtina]XP_045766269.1 uncharacterized protein LOC123867977 [Maniola jurtina]
MFKFVVLCAFLAAASATPGAVLTSLPYAAPAVVPAPALYSSYPSSYYSYSPSVVSAAALPYSAPFGYPHLIKKRSLAPLAVSSYIAPSAYLGSAPLVNSWTGAYSPYAGTYASPLATTYSSPLYTTAHLIKKRSAPLIVPSTYLASTPYATAPYAAAPLVASTYGAVGPYVSTPYYSAGPLAYTNFIKKRSAPLDVPSEE